MPHGAGLPLWQKRNEGCGMETKSNTTKGVVCIIVSAFCFSVMTVMVRMAGDLPSMQKSFFRNIVALCISTVYMVAARRRGGDLWRKGSFRFLLLRATFGTAALLCNFYAIDHMNLADASALNKLAPFFAMLCSAVFLKEPFRPLQIMAMLGAFAGALFIVQPTGDVRQMLPAICAVASALAGGAAFTTLRYLRNVRGESGIPIVFVFSLFSTLVTLPFFILQHQPMTAAQLGCLLLAGCGGGGGQIALTAAYRFSPAREISIYDYTQVAFTAVASYFLFGQRPNWASCIGYAVLFLIGLFMFQYNRRQHAMEDGSALPAQMRGGNAGKDEDA